MTDPVNNALDAFGAIGTYAQSNPELAGIFKQAVDGQWDAARFQRALWGTTWYKSLSETQKQMAVLQATDPAEYNAQLQNTIDSVNVLSGQLGLSGVDTRTFATQALNGGWANNTNLLSAHLIDFAGNNLNRDPNTGALSGVLGDSFLHIQTSAANYGVNVPQDQIDAWSREIAAGRQTSGGIDNVIVQWASRMYPQFAQEFAQGSKLSDIAQPYLQAMQQTLELNPASVSLQDASIQKALQGDGKTAMTMYQFNQMLRADPRWQQTTGAKNAAYDTLAKIGHDWGMM